MDEKFKIAGYVRISVDEENISIENRKAIVSYYAGINAGFCRIFPKPAKK